MGGGWLGGGQNPSQGFMSKGVCCLEAERAYARLKHENNPHPRAASTSLLVGGVQLVLSSEVRVVRDGFYHGWDSKRSVPKLERTELDIYVSFDKKPRMIVRSTRDLVLKLRRELEMRARKLETDSESENECTA